MKNGSTILYFVDIIDHTRSRYFMYMMVLLSIYYKNIKIFSGHYVDFESTHDSIPDNSRSLQRQPSNGGGNILIL